MLSFILLGTIFRQSRQQNGLKMGIIDYPDNLNIPGEIASIYIFINYIHTYMYIYISVYLLSRILIVVACLSLHFEQIIFITMEIF